MSEWLSASFTIRRDLSVCTFHTLKVALTVINQPRESSFAIGPTAILRRSSAAEQERESSRAVPVLDGRRVGETVPVQADFATPSMFRLFKSNAFCAEEKCHATSPGTKQYKSGVFSGPEKHVLPYV